MIGECSKCDGTGDIRAFSHIAGGVCFTCKGTGRLNVRAGLEQGAPDPRFKVWERSDCTVTYDGSRYTVFSRDGRCVYVDHDGEAVASDGVRDKPRAEAWARRLVGRLAT